MEISRPFEADQSCAAWLAVHWALLRHIALRYLRDPAEAEDCAAVCAAKLARVWWRYDPRCGTRRAWVGTIAGRTAIDAQRQRRTAAARRALLESRLAEHCADHWQVDPAALAVRRLDARAHLAAVWPALTAQQRSLALALAEGDSHTEAAARLGWPLGTLKTRLQRLRARAQESLAALH